jgi:hypothetical protein
MNPLDVVAKRADYIQVSSDELVPTDAERYRRSRQALAGAVGPFAIAIAIAIVIVIVLGICIAAGALL